MAQIIRNEFNGACDYLEPWVPEVAALIQKEGKVPSVGFYFVGVNDPYRFQEAGGIINPDIIERGRRMAIYSGLSSEQHLLISDPEDVYVKKHLPKLEIIPTLLKENPPKYEGDRDCFIEIPLTA